MDLHLQRHEVVLPYGLGDGRGGRYRRAAVTALNGRAELLAAAHANPFRAAAEVLAHCVLQLGPLDGPPATAALDGLIPLDRDYLLVQIGRLTWGDVQFATIACPAAGCGQRIDVRLDLAAVTVDRAPTSEILDVELPDGAQASFRLPRAADQIALFDGGLADADVALLRRLAVHPRDAERVADPELRRVVLAALAGCACELDADLPLRCPDCAHAFVYSHDPVRALLRNIVRGRRDLLLEVHFLALHYHWSHAEILALPCVLRREYIALLSDALDAAEAT